MNRHTIGPVCLLWLYRWMDALCVCVLLGGRSLALPKLPGSTRFEQGKKNGSNKRLLSLSACPSLPRHRHFRTLSSVLLLLDAMAVRIRLLADKDLVSNTAEEKLQHSATTFTSRRHYFYFARQTNQVHSDLVVCRCQLSAMPVGHSWQRRSLWLQGLLALSLYKPPVLPRRFVSIV